MGQLAVRRLSSRKVSAVDSWIPRAKRAKLGQLMRSADPFARVGRAACRLPQWMKLWERAARRGAEMSLYKFLTSAAVLWLSTQGPVGAAIHEARVSGGTVTGTVNNGVASFKGIPFAAPPVGQLRWKPPQPVIPWNGLRRSDSF